MLKQFYYGKESRKINGNETTNEVQMLMTEKEKVIRKGN